MNVRRGLAENLISRRLMPPLGSPKKPRQQNLWVDSGSGMSPIVGADRLDVTGLDFS